MKFRDCAAAVQQSTILSPLPIWSQGLKSKNCTSQNATSKNLYLFCPRVARRSVLLSPLTACPGLFYNTFAQDGILCRIRTPGGILNSQQFHLIANMADAYGGGYIDVTNRANLQIREIKREISRDDLHNLQTSGMAAVNPAIDHLRNIMTSPTAGIDPGELIDVRPLIQDWEQYINNQPELGELSAKFSVGFDGGGKVSIANFPNDISLTAPDATPLLVGGGRKEPKFFPTGKWGHQLIYPIFYFCATGKENFSPNFSLWLTPEQCIPVLGSVAQVYLEYTLLSKECFAKRKPRLREVINNVGWQCFLHKVLVLLHKSRLLDLEKIRDLEFQVSHAPSPNLLPNHKFNSQKHDQVFHLGIHPQKQSGMFYIGLVLPLGRLQTWQVRRLANMATQYGSGELRLTPWQNLLLTNIPQQHLSWVTSEIHDLQLDYSPTNIKSGLVSCSGSSGCSSSATDTKTHALILSEYLQTHINLDSHINIHFTGCPKSCAQHTESDITLLGVNIEQENQSVPAYQVYIGNNIHRPIYENFPFAQLPQLMENIFKVYILNRLSPQESFTEFANRYDISQLKEFFTQLSVECF
ncbi:hypothetical protein CEP10_15485 [Cylindrospermopsis raciborskii S07]|nr:hypothetical protein CRC_03196 [Cylindrospermopsis raciborskii CS-505]PNK03259.1 hypothetical protein CEP10_15485 [Cylindrospermopsis raciborskii S07]PNK08474.1 hypothetical protein CEP12_07020 [Cylindrospermopsis raciborskii S14]PNK11115.1 hypothetical protein CEP09_17150 [Cylindrospermopsis raciborskii S06]PNK15225.1 hypothetical protein CEP08_12165 [Cylindrospermopsis raciborskii S05]